MPAGALRKGSPASQTPFPSSTHLGSRLPSASRLAWAGRKQTDPCCRETQEILSPSPGRGTSAPFPVNEAVVLCTPPESQPSCLGQWWREQDGGRGLTVMSWTQWSAEMPWMQRREGWMPASWKALLMSLHFCCSGSEVVHHRTSILPSTGGRRQ